MMQVRVLFFLLLLVGVSYGQSIVPQSFHHAHGYGYGGGHHDRGGHHQQPNVIAVEGRTYGTIQEAINSVPDGNKNWVVINVPRGEFREKINIPQTKPYIIIQGAGMMESSISWGDTAASAGTADSATFTVWASNFVARDISFKNIAPAPAPGAVNQQAVAALVAGDMTAFYSCGFFGYQDTLFDFNGRHYYRDCQIHGSIDFIFGHAASVFKNCELHVNAISYSNGACSGAIAAQNRDSPTERSGYVFIDCKIMGTGKVFLGRAWGPYSTIVYINTEMDNVVTPEGWNDWGVPARQSTVFYGQYKCKGPGAVESARVPWAHELTDDQARQYMDLSFIDGASWLHNF